MRAKGRMDYEDLHDPYRKDRKALKSIIKTSKRRCWHEFCKEVDEDPSGRPYKIVTAKLKNSASTTPTCPELLQRIVATLFPEQQETMDQVTQPPPHDDVPLISREELMAACRRLQDGKAPGPDSVPNAAVKVAIDARPDLFLDVYNRCLREGCFPRCWKRQRLVLLPKSGKSPDDPLSYRSICLLDTAGKILERIVCNILETFIE